MDYKNDLHSDDDFDCSNSYGDSNGNGGYSSSRLSNPGGLSKAELRKTNKPIMEKRRRARINHCLNELKSLILEAMKKDPARHTKLEKADILEMTVKHLQSVQRQQLNMAIQTDPSVIHKFKTGFVECADEVNRYISQLDGVDSGVRQRLTSHLSNCATSLEQIGSMTNFNNGYRGQLSHAPGLFGNPLTNPLTATANPLASQVAAPAALFPPLPQDLNNNNSNQGAPIQMGGVQLIPSRLPSGEFALIVPSAAQAPAAAAVAPFPAWPAPTGLANATSPPQLNDFAASFQRMSAFSKPLHKSAFQSSLVNNNMNSNSNSNNNASGNNSNTTTATTTTSGSGSGNTSSPFTGGHLGAGGFHHQPQNNLHHNSTATTSPPLSPISSVSSHGDDSIMHTSSDFTIASRPATPPQDSAAVGQHSFSGVFSTPPSAESSLNGSGSGSASHLQQQQVSSTSGSESSAAVSPNGSGSAALKRRSAATDGSASDSSDSSDEPSAKKFLSAKSLGAELGDEDRDSMWRPW